MGFRKSWLPSTCCLKQLLEILKKHRLVHAASSNYVTSWKPGSSGWKYPFQLENTTNYMKLGKHLIQSFYRDSYVHWINNSKLDLSKRCILVDEMRKYEVDILTMLVAFYHCTCSTPILPGDAPWAPGELHVLLWERLKRMLRGREELG